MALAAEVLRTNMELTEIRGTSLKVSPVAIGTWAIGGWMWGGTDDVESIPTIRAAFDHGINIVDTAPAYGFGHSEEIVGAAIAEGGARTCLLPPRQDCNGMWKSGSQRQPWAHPEGGRRILAQASH